MARVKKDKEVKWMAGIRKEGAKEEKIWREDIKRGADAEGGKIGRAWEVEICK